MVQRKPKQRINRSPPTEAQFLQDEGIEDYWKDAQRIQIGDRWLVRGLEHRELNSVFYSRQAARKMGKKAEKELIQATVHVSTHGQSLRFFTSADKIGPNGKP